MYKFPKDLFTDVRVETVDTTDIEIRDGRLSANRTRHEKGAMIREYDGARWYYSAVSDVDSVQPELDSLSKLATPNPDIGSDGVVALLESNTGSVLRFEQNSLVEIPNADKQKMLESYVGVFSEYPEIATWRAVYTDNHTVKHIVSSKGADITFDTQNCCIAFRSTLNVNGQPYYASHDIYKNDFSKLADHQDALRREIERALDFARRAVPVEPGVYTCVLSPMVAGVFAHESFGHKSESDFMVGDETMMREWKLGSQVGAPILSIRESGEIDGSGYVPFDDEGTKAKDNYLIKQGKLVGRLHSGYTAAKLSENLTGNARAMNFQYEPIVRMTTTYIDKGDLTKEELFAGVEKGIYIENYSHGSGMSTFTIAPQRAYIIENGKETTPVKISVISGNVMRTLGEIDGLSNEVTLCSFGLGGCGKMEQFPLRVGMGGPYVRVKGIKVQ